MTRTFSKIYGLAALRLGWCTAAAPVIDAINRLRGPFNINTPALRAGIAAVGDQEHVALSIAHNRTWLRWLHDEITELGIPVTPSVANFLCCISGMRRRRARRIHTFWDAALFCAR